MKQARCQVWGTALFQAPVRIKMRDQTMMDMGYGLYEVQSQRLVMTAQMQQAIELLQCSALELNDYLTEFAAGNPLVEFDPVACRLERSWLQRAGTNRGGVQRQHGSFPLEQIVASEKSLLEDIALQVRTMKAPSEVVRIAVKLIGFLDDNGYFTESDKDMAAVLNVPSEAVAAGVEIIQQCEPRGLGARSLRECLRLQLACVAEPLRGMCRTVVDQHLEEVARGRIPQLAKRLRAPIADVQAAVDALRGLDPRPASRYRTEPSPYVVPDLVLREHNGLYMVEPNPDASPRYRINHTYQRLIPQRIDDETAAFLHKKLQSAQWLERCLEQRLATLVRVGQAVVDAQAAFFAYGITALKPLTMQQIADRLGIHESTVSRAARGKYLLTPRGLYELKYFFPAALQSDLGDASAGAAKYAIERCVAGEDKLHPLSDDAIAQVLSQRGIRISRRTVAKYREALGIAPSWRRKRYD